MHDAPLLRELVLVIAIAAAGAALFERLRLPSVAGFLVTGVLVGPGGLGLVGGDAIRQLAEFGVVFLLFEIGLELPLERLRRLLRVGLAAGALQVGVTLLGVAVGAVALGEPLPTALLLGALVAMSSTAVVMRQLSERGELDAPHGQVSLGILLFQDLCIVPFLLVVPLLAAGEGVGALDVAGALGRAVVAAALFLGVARFVVPWLLGAAARLRSREVFSLVAVLVVIGAAVGAEAIGLTLAVGAFLAGLVANSSPYGAQLFAEVLPLRGVLLGIFFTAVGMLLDPRAALAAPGALVLLLLAAVPGKAVITALLLRLGLRQPTGVSVRAGMVLAQTGEFSFVLAAVAAGLGLLDGTQQQIFVAASVASLVATPFLVRAGPRVAQWLGGGAAAARRAADEETPQDHALLVGYGLANRNVARVLRALEVRVVAVEANARAVAEARARGEEVVYGDATRLELLRRLGAHRARVVVVAITDPVATRQVVALVRRLGGPVKVLARTRYVLDVDGLQAVGADRVVAEELEAAIDLVSQVLREFAVPDGAVGRFATQLRDEGYALLQAPAALDLDPWLAELLEEFATEWLQVDALEAPATLVELALRARTGASVLAVERSGVTTPNPPGGFAIEPGDRLLVFGGGDAISRARALLTRDAPG